MVSSRAFFKSEDWGYMEAHLSPAIRRYLREEEDFILQYAGSVDALVDVGCGEGRIVDLLLRSRENKRIFGIDISELSVKRCREKYRGKVNISLQDARFASFEDSSMDAAVFSFNLLGNLNPEDRAALIQEARRYLKPAGFIVGSVYAKNAAPFQVECYKDYLGFNVPFVDRKFVHFRTPRGNEIISERFGKKELEEIMRRRHFYPQVEKKDFSLFYSARKV
ncbi:MAG TPA: class I SAM-dependent methyltransferase [archaeon]|nr:class I SAM-dependent methyltransferase [archaeon]